MSDIATRIKRVVMSATEREITTDSITVLGVSYGNTSNSVRTVSLKDNDDNTILCMYNSSVIKNYTFEVPWLADNGLKVTIDSADSNACVTVFYKP